MLDRLRRRISRLFRFRLRTLLVLTAVVAAALGWFNVRLRESQEQRRIAEAIERAGGMAFQAYPGKRSYCPTWLRDLLGEDFFVTVDYVESWRAQLSDADLVDIGKLTGLRHLELARTPVTDAGLEHLARLTELRELILTGTRVSDAGLAHLKGLTQLESLHLSGTDITDAWLADLRFFPHLRALHLDATSISDRGLRHLQTLKQLEVLGLSGIPELSDAGLAYVGTLTSLKDLEFRSPNVTDDGLMHLCNLSRLEMLWVGCCCVSTDGVRRLQKAIPKLRVFLLGPDGSQEVMRSDEVMPVK